MDTFILLILASIVTGVLSLTVAVVLITRGTWTAYLIKFGTPFAAGVFSLLLLGICYHMLLKKDLLGMRCKQHWQLYYFSS